MDDRSAVIRSAIEEFLDEVGKILTPENIRWFVGQVEAGAPSKGQPGEHGLVSRLWFVLDTSIALATLRYQLAKGRSGIVDGLRSGLLCAIAPPLLDAEIRRHAARVAMECGKAESELLGVYEHLVKPYITFRAPGDAARATAATRIADKDDVDFLALSIETGVSVIATKDQAFGVDGETVVIKVPELSEIHIVCRKGATAMFAVTMGGGAAIQASIGAVRAVNALIAGAIARPQVLMAVGGVALLLAALFPEDRKRIADAMKGAIGSIGEGLKAAAPILLQTALVAGERVNAATDRARQTDPIARNGP